MATRVLRQNSSEVKDSLPAQASIREELEQMVEKGVFDLSRVKPWADVSRQNDQARVVDAILPTAIKNEESEYLRKYKSRLVANGANLRGVRGEKFEEDLRHVIPASLAGLRTCFAYELLTGEFPFATDDHLRAVPPDVSQACPGASPQLAQALKTAMAREAKDRYPSMGDFLQALG